MPGDTTYAEEQALRDLFQNGKTVDRNHRGIQMPSGAERPVKRPKRLKQAKRRCRVCGGQGELRESVVVNRPSVVQYYYRCEKCGFGPPAFHKTEKDARVRWCADCAEPVWVSRLESKLDLLIEALGDGEE